ncbi:unnamed protein product [Rhodiola kirilowii]
MKNSVAYATFLLVLLMTGIADVTCQMGPIKCTSLKNTLPRCTSSACEKFCVDKYQNFRPASAISWTCFGVNGCTCTLCHD